MQTLRIGLLWAIAFILIESVQFVYFGSLFQSVSTYLFGFMVFGVISLAFITHSRISTPNQIKIALRNKKDLLGLNVVTALTFLAYLLSVGFIEPAIVYTISAGVMPIAAWLSQVLGISAKKRSVNGLELAGMLFLFASIVFLSVITIQGASGFVREGANLAHWGVALAIADGVLFTWMLVYSENLDHAGVSPNVVFGLRFPIFVLLSGMVMFSGFDPIPVPSLNELLIILLLGLLLTVPHLFALQKSIAYVSTAAISALITLGPFVIFVLQLIEGRVAYSDATLTGLIIYAIGSALVIFGSVKSQPQQLD
ncbi:MAG: hypothetical protein AAF402_06755 [Pseudomonadota bacterium]